MGTGCSESHASARIQQPVACSSESSFKGFYQSGLGEHTDPRRSTAQGLQNTRITGQSQRIGAPSRRHRGQPARSVEFGAFPAPNLPDKGTSLPQWTPAAE
jgi:hypothetical protein